MGYYLYGENGGTIRFQIGASLDRIQAAVDVGDAYGLADHLTLLVAKCSPILTGLSNDERAALIVPSLRPGRDRTGAEAQRLFQDCMRILAALLCHMAERKHYAYVEPAPGDGRALALKGEEPEEAAVESD